MTPQSMPLIGIVGPSGSGKSTSLRNLNPITTHIIDLERKGLPFPHKFIHLHTVDNVGKFDNALGVALADPQCKVIVIESFTRYAELALEMAQSAYKGYDIWNAYNLSLRRMLNRIKNTQAIVILTAIDEIVRIPNADGSESAQRRIAVQGKQHEGKIEKELVMVMFAEPRKDPKTGRVSYRFACHTDGITSAKSPLGMFTEETTHVDNDIAAVIKRWEEYTASGVGDVVEKLSQ